MLALRKLNPLRTHGKDVWKMHRPGSGILQHGRSLISTKHPFPSWWRCVCVFLTLDFRWLVRVVRVEPVQWRRHPVPQPLLRGAQPGLFPVRRKQHSVPGMPVQWNSWYVLGRPGRQGGPVRESSSCLDCQTRLRFSLLKIGLGCF